MIFDNNALHAGQCGQCPSVLTFLDNFAIAQAQHPGKLRMRQTVERVFAILCRTSEEGSG